jgi:hypothetical protein
VLRFIPTRTNTSKLEPLRHQMIAELSTKKVVPLASVCTGGAQNAFSEPPRARIIQPAFLSLLETSVRQGAALPSEPHTSRVHVGFGVGYAVSSTLERDVARMLVKIWSLFWHLDPSG